MRAPRAWQWGIVLAGQHLNGRWVTIAYRQRWEEFFGTGSIYGQ